MIGNNSKTDDIYSNQYNTNCNILNSVIIGCTIGLVFNPWDKAAYLSHLHHRPFWSKINFKNPFQGTPELIIHRIASSGIFFFMQSELRKYVENHNIPYLHATPTADFIIGLTSGVAASTCSAPLKAIKTYRWGHDNQCSFKNIINTYKKSGFCSFTRGSISTIGRDSVWGGSYELIRQNIYTKINENNTPLARFIANSFAAGSATIIASPFNYLINQRLHHEVQNFKQPSPSELFKKLINPPNKETALLYAFKRLQITNGVVRTITATVIGQTIADSDLNDTFNKFKSL